MKRVLLKFALAALVCLPLSAFSAERIKVACIGDSITYGTGIENRDKDSYPAQLRSLLGDDYQLRAFGKPGATLLFRGHRPYVKQQEFSEAMEYCADIAVIHLGVNDTDPRDWPDYRDDFTGDYLAIIDSLRGRNPLIRIIIAVPTPLSHNHPRFLSGTRDWLADIRDAVRTVSEAAGCELIDFYSPLHPNIAHFRDGVHPDEYAAGIMARVAYSRITGDYGGLSLPEVYSDNMVIQRDTPIHIRGIADAGELVSVEFAGMKANVIAGKDGRWSVCLSPMKAGSGYTMRVSTKAKQVQFNNVAVGEVWLCSGQSNMRFMLKESAEYHNGLSMSEDANLRFFDSHVRWGTSNRSWPLDALDEVDRLNYFQPASWAVSDSVSASDFSAVAFWFGHMLRDSLKVPVGLICNAVGGSTAESWIDRETLEFNMPEILKDWLHNDFIQAWARKRAMKNLSAGNGQYTRHPYEPAYLFEASMSQLEGFDIKGVLWYQGESNAHNYEAHERLFHLLLKSWQQLFHNPELPFCYVQLSSLNRPSWPWFRDSQRRLLQAGNHLGMVVSSDLGDSLDVHYKTKRQVGIRAALWALNREYGFSDIVPSGPLFRNASAHNGEIRVFFDYDDGLKASDGDLNGFEVAGADLVFRPAKSRIDGEKVVVYSEEVPSPRYVRYAWAPYTRANLVNVAGLPASTFIAETDNKNMNKKTLSSASLPPVLDREYSKGVSAPFFGALGKRLILAGGANFPDKPLLEGGAKKVYSDIWIKDEGQPWVHAGTLPDSVAYGACFSLGKNIVFAGGDVAGKPSDKVYSLKYSCGKLRIKTLPSLPQGIEQAGWGAEGDCLYIVGGITSDGRSDAVYRFSRNKWERIATLPAPMVQPVAFASGGKLYVWGGFNPSTLDVYSTGWCLDLASGEWTETAGVPDGGTFVGASGTLLPDGRFTVIGGVNKGIFAKALHNGPEDRIPYLSMDPADYHFRSTIYAFDPVSESWEELGRGEGTALAGAGVCTYDNSLIVAGGEIKPGVRSSEIIIIKL